MMWSTKNKLPERSQSDVMKTSLIKAKKEECEMGISSVISLAQTEKVKCATKGTSSSSTFVMLIAMWVKVMRNTFDKLVEL